MEGPWLVEVGCILQVEEGKEDGPLLTIVGDVEDDTIEGPEDDERAGADDGSAKGAPVIRMVSGNLVGGTEGEGLASDSVDMIVSVVAPTVGTEDAVSE